jgi:hypothetical protein
MDSKRFENVVVQGTRKNDQIMRQKKEGEELRKYKIEQAEIKV